MNQFLGLLSLNFKSHFYFRVAAIFSLFSSLVIFLIQSSLWSKLGNSNYTQYFAVVAITNSVASFATERYLQGEYQSGNIVLWLIRPISFGKLCFLQDLAGLCSNFILHTLPLLILLKIFFQVKIFYGFINLALFCISLFCAFIFSWLLSYLIGLAVVFYKNNEGIIQFKNIFLGFLAGGLVPLDIFPDFLRNVLYYLPFRVLYQIPQEILGSKITDTINLIGLQAFWIVIGSISVFYVQNKAINKMEIMGG